MKNPIDRMFKTKNDAPRTILRDWDIMKITACETPSSYYEYKYETVVEVSVKKKVSHDGTTEAKQHAFSEAKAIINEEFFGGFRASMMQLQFAIAQRDADSCEKIWNDIWTTMFPHN